MKVGFIGAGKVGFSLGKYLADFLICMACGNGSFSGVEFFLVHTNAKTNEKGGAVRR